MAIACSCAFAVVQSARMLYFFYMYSYFLFLTKYVVSIARAVAKRTGASVLPIAIG